MVRRSLLALLLLVMAEARPLFAGANIVIVNSDPAGTGLNDLTPVAPVGGNAGTTLGQQRLIVFQQAAAIWGSLLTSTVTIRVSASFAPLDCTATTAILGSTRPNTVYSDFAGAPVAGTWYVKALADKLAGSDRDGTTVDMTAQFNSNLGQAGCFTGIPFYLGLDNNHGSNVNFLTVALHEFAHGLGFYSVVTSNGAFLGGQPAIFDRFVYDDTLGQTLDKLTGTQRATSVANTGNLTWSGTAANAFVASYLSKRQRLLVTAPAAAAGTYAVATFPFGAALSNPGATGQIVAATDGSDAVGPSTTDGCSAFTNAPQVAGQIALIDRGTCHFTDKVKNAQNAGAIGAVIADNVTEGLDSFTPSGSDPTITIPAVLITMSDGAKLRANLPASANLGTDATLLAGADAAGRTLLYAPNPFQVGGSLSHFDTSAFPNLLMEPNISDDLPIGVDATLPLFNDIGWFAGMSGPTTSYLLPSSAHSPGRNLAFYTTDLTVANRGTTDANLTLQFLGHDRDGTQGPKQLRALATNRAVTYADVLASLFGVNATDFQNFGALLITADSASLKIVSQTSTPPPNGVGTFGQSVPAQGANDFVTPASPKSLVGLRDDTAFRTNAFLANATTSSATVTLTLLAGDGSTFGTTTRTLPPLGMTQVSSVVTALGAPFGTTNAVLVVSTAEPGAQVGTYAAVIDNITNDPRTILP
jgi:hypothetical protein